MFHHDGEELNDDFGAGSDENLSLATPLCSSYAPQSVSQHVHSHHIHLQSQKSVFDIWI